VVVHADLLDYLVYAAFALEKWQIKESFPELKDPVGKQI
jgi:hypothetical protein